MAYYNRIRLPLYLKTPQFPTEANRFRLSNGESKTLSVTIRKQYNIATDYMSQTMHQRLVVALNHDTVNIEGDRYVGGVSVDGDYEITWPDFLDYPLGQAGIKIQVTPFDMTNDNCKTCDEMSQLSLVDDDAGEIDEGMDTTINVFANDSICCFPIVAAITWFNTAYLENVTIDANGNVTIVPKNVTADVGSIIMATYRVTCPGGVYDEADVYASINGTEPACEQPSVFDAIGFSDPPPPFTVTLGWALPAIPPALGYEWELYLASDLGTPVLTGTTAVNSASFEAEFASTDYSFFVRSICAVGEYSLYFQIDFTTPASAVGNCGTFELTANDGTLSSTLYLYSFMDCSGNIQNGGIVNLTTKTECMIMDAFNVPLYFNGNPAITINYIGAC